MPLLTAGSGYAGSCGSVGSVGPVGSLSAADSAVGISVGWGSVCSAGKQASAGSTLTLSEASQLGT